MIAKPIFIIETPLVWTADQQYILKKALCNKFEDYYILVLKGNDNGYKFTAFYEKDFNDVKYDELKKIIESKILE